MKCDIPGLTFADPLKAVGPDDNPECRLWGRIDLLGASFHVDLYQVHEVDDGEGGTNQEVVNEEHCKYSDLMTLNGGYEPLATITLNGKTYVMCIYPFCA